MKSSQIFEHEMDVLSKAEKVRVEDGNSVSYEDFEKAWAAFEAART